MKSITLREGGGGRTLLYETKKASLDPHAFTELELRHVPFYLSNETENSPESSKMVQSKGQGSSCS